MRQIAWVLLCLTFTSQAFGAEAKFGIWCDSRTRNDGKIYSIIFTLHHDVENSTCTALGESGEYQFGADHEFDCKIEATEKNASPIYRIELVAKTTSVNYGDKGRAAVSLGIFHDFNSQFGQGLARLQGGGVVSLTCVPGPMRKP